MITELFRKRVDVDPAILRTGAPELEPNVTAPTIVRDSQTGEAALYIARFAGDLAAYRQALRAYPMSTVTRAAGTHNNSRTFGYLARKTYLKRESCRPCEGATVSPREHVIICEAATALTAHLLEVLPERDHDRIRGEDISPDWRIGGWWTSGVVNYDSPLPYHYDANNYPCWSAMPVVRRGITGGYLHIPAYDIVAPCRDGDVVYFPGYELMHGVTPMHRSHGGYRISAVYYTVAAMRHCADADEELRRGQVARSDRETGLLERQRGNGLLHD